MAEAPKKNPIALLTLARLRESVREPGILFWVIAFPVFLSLGLGLAFRNPGPPTTTVGVLAGPGASPLVSTLSKAGVEASELQPETARERLRSGQIAMVITSIAIGSLFGCLMHDFLLPSLREMRPRLALRANA